MNTLPDRKKMYKLPWSLTDNQGGWVEVTDQCDLNCPGCYRKRVEGDRKLEDIKRDILLCREKTNCDVMVLAGGEPLLYREILEVIRFIRENGMKSLMLSNGTSLDEKLAKELATAGLNRIHLHVDSRQSRPGWEGKNEAELAPLRDQYARIIRKAKSIQCGFHITVGQNNLEHIPGIVSWVRNNLSRVQHLSLITLRGLQKPDDYHYAVGDTALGNENLKDFFLENEKIDISTADLFHIIEELDEIMIPAAFVASTAFPEINKYLVYVNIGTKSRFYGCFGAKSMELSQVFYHLFFGRYLSFSTNPVAGDKVFLLSLFDRQVGKALGRFLRSLAGNPLHLFEKVYIQSMILQQPTEFIQGVRNLCDPCINPMVYGDKLINPCQMDEYRVLGGLLRTVKSLSEKQNK